MGVGEPARAFDAIADRYDDDGRHAAVADRLVSGIRSGSPTRSVVDVATGTGAAAFAALRRLDPGHVVAFDVSGRMIARARRAAAVHDPDGRITWLVAAAVPLPVDDRSVDVVVCASSLHFLGAAALTDWARVLRPGGLVAVHPAR